MIGLDTVTAVNIAWFQHVGAGWGAQTPWLPVACWMARYSSWIAGALVVGLLCRQPRRFDVVTVALLAALVANLAAHALAGWLNLPRPFMLGLSPAYIEHGGRGGLPSAHSTVMFAVAGVYFLERGLRGWGAALLVVAALTGWARVYVGVHFPIDVLSGAILGVALAWLVRALAVQGLKLWLSQPLAQRF